MVVTLNKTGYINAGGYVLLAGEPGRYTLHVPLSEGRPLEAILAAEPALAAFLAERDAERLDGVVARTLQARGRG